VNFFVNVGELLSAVPHWDVSAFVASKIATKRFVAIEMAIQ
jgi:hypothetical protein